MSPGFTRDFQPALLRGTRPTPHGYAYGAITLYGPAFQPRSASRGRRRRDPATPHPPWVSPRGSVCPLPLSVAPTQGIPIGFFSSPYLDASVRGVPAPCPERRWLPTGRKSHSAIPGSTATCAYPGLIAACHGLPRRPSRAIHQVASLCRALFGVSSWRVWPVPSGSSWVSPLRSSPRTPVSSQVASSLNIRQNMGM